MPAAPPRYPAAAPSLLSTAAALGLSLDALLRQIHDGEARAESVERPRGSERRVHADDGRSASHRAARAAPGTVRRPPTPPAEVTRAGGPVACNAAPLELLLRLVGQQQRTIRDQAEELGRLRERFRMLGRPVDPTPTPAPEPSRAP